MITENNRLAMYYRDSGLWKEDFPTCYGNVDNNRCSKCGETLENVERIYVSIPSANGIEHYEYHKPCIANALDNVTNVNVKRNLKSKPIFYAFKS